MNRWAKFSTAVVAASVVAASTVSAQSNTANINVTATVFQAINVVGTAPLAFGNVFPGVPKTVNAVDPTSGRWSATGQASAPVAMTFTLPTDLANGGNNLAIATWTGCHNATAATAGCTSFTPSGTATNAAFSGIGELFVFIGATVTPLANQAAGNYTAVATITLAYF